MFRALVPHPQEALNIQDLVYCVRVMYVGCGKVAVLYARNIPNAVCIAPPEDEQLTLETCI
jgi:hypothetical protein